MQTVAKRLTLAGVALLAALAAALTPAPASAQRNAFCEGYRTGYHAGYCHRQMSCLRPLPPLCPLPNIGERSWQDGYNRGFLDGLSARG